MHVPKKDKEEIAKKIEEATRGDVPHIYFNGLSTSLGASDIVCALFNQGKPTGTLNMSYSMAKTMAQQLNWAIESLEKKTGHEIMTMDFINRKLAEEDSEGD